MKHEIVVIYDKECPICNHFACAIDERNTHIVIINGREESQLLKEASEYNLDIDHGSIVYADNQFYYGTDAFHLVANHSDAKGLVGFANNYLFRHKPVAVIVYPLLVLIRKCLLKLMGKQLIKQPLPENQVPAVYYNSACPVCDAGIKHQQEKMKSCDIDWKDVHTNTDARSDLKTELEFIRKRLHVVSSTGEVKVGIDAFIALWTLSPGEQWKAKLFNFPGIHAIGVLAYNGFAWLLYRWNKWLKHW